MGELAEAPLQAGLSAGSGWLVLHRPRGATWLMFFISGSVVGTWAANIPVIRARLEASTAEMSVCLLAMGMATVLTGLVVGRILVNRSTAKMTRAGALIVPLAGMGVMAAPSLGLLALALAVLGATFGVLDVSMNAHGVAIEKRMGSAIMSSLHGGWSIGGLVGAGLAAFGHLVDFDPGLEAVIYFAVLLLAGIWFGGYLGAGEPGSGAEVAPPPRLILPSRRVFLIGCFAMLTFAVEGTVTDWSGLYVVRVIHGSGAIAAAAIAGFSGGMALGRMIGDPLNRAFGPARLLRVGDLLAGFSLCGLIALGDPAFAVPALVLAGLGVANGAPLLFSAAGGTGGMPPGAAITATATLANLGLLVMPPLLGAAAQISSLAVAVGTAGALALLVALGSGRLLGRRGEVEPRSSTR